MNKKFSVLTKNLKLLRLIHDLSQEDLSSKIRLSRSSYNAYETGARAPDLQTIFLLSALYNISVSSLVYYDLSKIIFLQPYLEENDSEFLMMLRKYETLSLMTKSLLTKKSKHF